MGDLAVTSRIGVAPQDCGDCGDPDVTWLTARAVALLVILRGGPLAMSKVAKALREKMSNASPLVNDVESLGLVRVYGATGIVQLTDEGRDYIARSGSAL